MSRTSNYQISVYASGLKNVAGFGKGTSDPYAVVTLLAGSDDHQARILGRTEVIKNDLNPSWTTTFKVKHCFGKETRINICVFDEVRKSKGNKSMGSAQFEIGEILGSKGNVKAKRLKPGGTLFVRVTRGADLDLGTFHFGLKGSKLKNMDGIFGKSDPFFVVETFAKGNHGGRQWLPVYRSEHIKNNLNPNWRSCDIPVEKLCNGDKEQPIQISVYDWEKNGSHQSMGKCQTNTNGLLAAGQQQNTFDLIRKGKCYGKLLVTRAEITGVEMNPNKPPPKFAMVAGVRQINPDYKKWQVKYGRGGQVSGSMISSSTEKSSSSRSRREEGRTGSSSRHRRSDGNSGGHRKSEGDSSRKKSESGRHHDRSPIRSSRGGSRKGSSYKAPSYDPSNSLISPPAAPPPIEGLTIDDPSTEPPPVNQKPNFFDYVSGGTEINLSIAIDFTGSNGDPRKPDTLHYIHRDGQFNDYEKAITAVASIVARYDSDQMFPVYGFGAKFGGEIQHCFQVGNSAELNGIPGVIEGYRNVFKTGLTMSGPTVFAEVILQAAVQAQSKQEADNSIGKQSYSILLIMTDGDVQDLEVTRQAIKYASSAPLSIVIVGVGYEDFAGMQYLDDFHMQDDEVRDIVQFVEFNRHRDNRQHLTQETLDEIPDQLVDYFLGQGIQPLPPIQGKRESVLPEEYNSKRDVELDIQEGVNGDLELRNSSMARFDTKSYGNTKSMMSGDPIMGELPPDPSQQGPSTPPRSSGNGGQMATPGSRSQNNTPSRSASGSSGYAAPSNNAMSSPEPEYGGRSGGYAAPSNNAMPSPEPKYGGRSGGYAALSNNAMPSPEPKYGGGSGGYAAPTNNSMPSFGTPGGYNPGGYNPGGALPPAVQSAPQTVTLRVRAPPNSYPGMQIRVAHPNTGQLHVVSIPEGVRPGGDFRVNLR